MAQAQIDVTIQTAGQTVEFGKLFTQTDTDALIAYLLNGVDETWEERYPVLADRIIARYKWWLREIHNGVIRKQLVKDRETPGDAWPET